MSSPPVTVVKDMAVTPAEFFRILPRALPSRRYDICGRAATVDEGDCQVTIAVEPAPPRRLARVVIERSIVTLTFTACGSRARLAFLARFDRAFQRGGG